MNRHRKHGVCPRILACHSEKAQMLALYMLSWKEWSLLGYYLSAGNTEMSIAYLCCETALQSMANSEVDTSERKHQSSTWRMERWHRRPVRYPFGNKRKRERKEHKTLMRYTHHDPNNRFINP